jgi:hypothetical protein
MQTTTVHVALSLDNRNKLSVGANLATKPSVQEPEYKEDIKLDTARFNMLNNKFGPFKIELFASKTNNLLPINYTRRRCLFHRLHLIPQTMLIRTPLYGNPKYTNDDIYRALDKAVSEFQKQPETTKYMFILPKW